MADTPRPTATARAEALASALPPLLVQAERVAATVAQGVHGRRRVGPGDQFWQYRRYQAGDAVSAIDWRQTAKSEYAFVREHEWAAAQTALLWSAGGPGMDWRSADTLPTKRDRARLLTLALAALLLRGGERVGLLGSAERPAVGRTVLPRLALALDAATDDTLPTVAQARHATIVVLGDFLTPLPEIEDSLRRLAANGARGHLLQVLDPAEESLPWQGRVRFTAVTGGASWTVARTEEVRGAYTERLARHRDGLRALARSFGWTFDLHHTGGPPEPALLALFQAISGGAAGGRG